jgi:hypothetical protein
LDIIIIKRKFIITMTSNSQTLHIRRNVCEIMIIEDDIGKHIGTQEHQIRKKGYGIYSM